MGVWIWGIFFSAPDNDLGLCFPVHANLSPGGYFFMNNSDFFGPGGGGGGGGGGRPCLLSSGPAHWSLWVSEALRQNTTRESYF